MALLERNAELEALGITFVSLKDNLDLSTPSGRFMFQIVAAFAELERAMIQERVRAGLQNAKRKGKRLGRPHLPVDLARVASLRDSGVSWRTISKQMGFERRQAAQSLSAAFIKRIENRRRKSPVFSRWFWTASLHFSSLRCQSIARMTASAKRRARSLGNETSAAGLFATWKSSKTIESSRWNTLTLTPAPVASSTKVMQSICFMAVSVRTPRP